MEGDFENFVSAHFHNTCTNNISLVTNDICSASVFLQTKLSGLKMLKILHLQIPQMLKSPFVYFFFWVTRSIQKNFEKRLLVFSF